VDAHCCRLAKSRSFTPTRWRVYFFQAASHAKVQRSPMSLANLIFVRGRTERPHQSPSTTNRFPATLTMVLPKKVFVTNRFWIRDGRRVAFDALNFTLCRKTGFMKNVHACVTRLRVLMTFALLRVSSVRKKN